MKSKAKISKSNVDDNFLKKNWFNIISLTFSLIALLISIQTNIYNKKSTSSDITIRDGNQIYGDKSLSNANNKPYFYLIGCYDPSSNQYVIQHRIGGEFWISNNGGIDATLLFLDFVSDIELHGIPPSLQSNRWNASYYLSDDRNSASGTTVLVLDIPSGKTTFISTTARGWSYFQSRQEAIDYFNALTNNGDSYEIDKRGIWIFRFGDGTTLTYTYDSFKRSPINVSGEFNSLDYLNTPCGELQNQ